MDNVKLSLPVRYVDSSVLGACPASVRMDTGLISINQSVWPRYDNFQKSFVLMHEVGHYELDTDSEYEADAYALRKVYKTAPRSLKRSLQTLLKLHVLDSSRLARLYEEALKLDAADGNEIAAIELNNINQQYFNHKKSKKMRATPGRETYMNKRNVNTMRVVRRADGAERGHGMNGLHIGDWYFSFTNILLIAIVLILLTRK